MARLSVLLPCRDAAVWLPAALRSLERQTFTDFEIIAVDDGSTDATSALLDDCARRDHRVRVLRPGPVGLVEALRLAASSASGELLARMDADDIARAHRFERQVELLDGHAGIAACGTRIRYFPRAGLKEGARAYERWINACIHPDIVAREIFVECPIAHPTLMVRRAAFEAVGGYRDAGWPEDYDLVLRMWRAGLALTNVPGRLLAWRERPDRTSRVNERYSRAAFRRCKVHYLLDSLARGRPFLVGGAGPTGKAFAREVVRRGGTLAAFVDIDPRKVGQTVHGVPVVRPERIPEFAGTFGVAAVADPAAREEIRTRFRSCGWREMADFCAVA